MSQAIQIENRPSGVPIPVSALLTSAPVTIIDTPYYLVPETGFVTSEDLIASPCVAEFSSAILAVNKHTSVVRFFARITRRNGDVSHLAFNYPCGAEDTTIIPANGQMLVTGDKLEVWSDINNVLEISFSYTRADAEQDDTTAFDAYIASL